MIKELLLALSVIGTLAGGTTSRTSYTMLREEETEVPPESWYSEERFTTIDNPTEQDFDITRTYKKNCPYYSIEKHFKAPSAWVYVLKMSDQQRDDFIDTIRDIKTISFRMTSFIFYRDVNGFPFYVDSDNRWISDDIDTFATNLQDMVDGYVIGEATEGAEHAILGGHFDIEVVNGDYNTFKFRFDLQEQEIKPFVVSDIFSANVSYYKTSEEERITVSAYLDDDVFNADYGYVTDERYVALDGSFYIDYYVVDFYANDSVLLMSVGLDEATKSIEFQKISDTPMKITAIARLNSDHKQYTFEAEPIVVQDPEFNILVDGFDNRTTIGKGVEHNLQIVLDNTDLGLLDYDYSGTSLYASALNVETDEYIELYTNENMFNTDEPFTIKEDHFSFDFKFDKAGKYDLDLVIYLAADTFGMFYDFHAEIECIEEEPYHVPANEIFKLKNRESTSINAITNGEDIVIETSVDPTSLNSKGEVEYTFETSRTGVIDVVETDGTFTIKPLAPGNVTLTLIANSDTFENLKQTLQFHVFDDFTSAYSFVYEDGFHQSKEDFDVSLKIEDVDDIENANIEWTVVDAEGNPAAFTIKNRNTITITEPPSGDYTVSATVNGNKVGETTIQFRAMDMNKFVRQNILWIFLITVGFMTLILVFKGLISKPRSLDKRLEKAYEEFNKLDPKDESAYISGLKRVKGMLSGALSQAEDLNIDSHNQYEKIIRYIKKTISSVKVLIKQDTELGLEEKGVKLQEVTETSFRKTVSLAKEMSDAQAMIEENHRQANLNNYARVENEKKPKKSKKAEPVVEVAPTPVMDAPIEEAIPMAEENADVVRCPYCGSNKVNLTDTDEYICADCKERFKLENEHNVADAEDAPSETADGSTDGGSN
ncbi:MAG: hypothetical protein MJ238_04250 [Bacilli bacterium]|nr:hypothetical protein [Bacilli bacterium]